MNGSNTTSIDTEAVEPDPSGDEDDDFGDFNDAQVEPIHFEALQEPRENFGDFTDFNESTDISLPSATATSEFGIVECAVFGDFNGLAEQPADIPSIPDDPIVAKAKIIFSHVFNSITSQDENENFEECSPPIVFVRDVLVRQDDFN